VSPFDREQAVPAQDRLDDLDVAGQESLRRLLDGCLRVDMRERLTADEGAKLMKVPDGGQ